MEYKKKASEESEQKESITAFLQRIVINKELKYEGENLFLMGVPSFLFALNTLVVMQKSMADEFGQKGLSAFYHLLGYQSGNAAQLMKNRFGFPTEKAMRMQQGHLPMLGAGDVDFIRFDLANNHFILRGTSTFAKEYINTFGIQKDPVCWMMRGGAAYMINVALERNDFLCIETSCIAQGKQYCEFVARPKNAFDLLDQNIKKQVPSELKTDFLGQIMKNFMGMPKRE